MFKSIAANSMGLLLAVGVSTALAATYAFVPEAGASTAIVSQPTAKGDRLGVLIQRPACTLQGWPYYAQRCQFDFRTSTAAPKAIRLIALR
jgi:hypothetical protein